MRLYIHFFSILLPFWGYSQTPDLEVVNYKGTQYFVFPEPQKRHFNPDMYWLVKKGSQVEVALFPKDGDWIQFYKEDRGMVAKLFQIKDGLPHGKYQRFDFNGDLKEEGEFYKGSRNGKWVIKDEFYKDGYYTAIGTYKPIDSGYFKLSSHPYHFIKDNYGKDSVWVYSDEQQTTIKTEFYINGSKEGKWVVNYPNGKKKTEQSFRNGLLDGAYKKWSENGTLLLEEEYKNGIREGVYNEWYQDGKSKCSLTYHADSITNGQCTLYYETGEKYAEGQLDKGVKVGKWVYYYQNGTVRAKGQFQTFVTQYCVSALPQNYYHSAMTGTWTYWDNKNTKIAEGTFIPEHTETSRGYYYEGKKSKNWQYWDSNGNPIKEKKSTNFSFDFSSDKLK